MQPGRPERYGSEYERHGVWSVFLACEPLMGKRFVQVRAQPTRQDWAHFVRDLLDVQYPLAQKLILILVMDNLHTQTIGSLYETFAPEEAQRLCLRVEIHSTPKQGSWLNMAEIELSAVGRQCLDRRMGTLEDVQREVASWQHTRTQARVTMDWRFTTADARIKLKRLYPVIT